MNTLFMPRQAQFVHSAVAALHEQYVRMTVLSERLAARIEQLGIHVNEAARRCGFGEKQYRVFQYYVTGERGKLGLPPDIILRICDGLEMTPNDLYGVKPVPTGLAPDEAVLLEKYRALTAVQQTALLTLIAVSQDIASLPFTGT